MSVGCCEICCEDDKLLVTVGRCEHVACRKCCTRLETPRRCPWCRGNAWELVNLDEHGAAPLAPDGLAYVELAAAVWCDGIRVGPVAAFGHLLPASAAAQLAAAEAVELAAQEDLLLLMSSRRKNSRIYLTRAQFGALLDFPVTGNALKTLQQVFTRCLNVVGGRPNAAAVQRRSVVAAPQRRKRLHAERFAERCSTAALHSVVATPQCCSVAAPQRWCIAGRHAHRRDVSFVPVSTPDPSCCVTGRLWAPNRTPRPFCSPSARGTSLL